MKYKTQPTSEELIMREGEFIVSKTDLKGRITYANRTFIEFAGYTEEELIGAPHNIIRHPDMPRAIFKLLWDTIQSGNEIFAYVKNMSKNGAFYWVYANVTPTLDADNRPVGYYSVRRKPNANSIAAIEQIYREMLSIEQRSAGKDGMAASIEYLMNYLKERKVSYEEFIVAV